MMTGVELPRLRSSRSTSRPPRCGSPRSSSTRSKCEDCKAAPALLPSRIQSTAKDAWRSAVCRPCPIISSSSTSNTRMPSNIQLRSEAATRGVCHLAGGPAASPLHLHQFLHRYHVVVQVFHDPKGTEDNQTNDQDPEGEGEHVVLIVGRSSDVQEEDEMDAHLGDSEYEQRQGEAGSVDEAGASDPEGGRGEPHRERESECVASHLLAERALSGGGFSSGQTVLTDVRASIEFVFTAHGNSSRGRVPTRYTKLKIPTQMISRACQKRLKHRKRWRMSRRNPFA